MVQRSFSNPARFKHKSVKVRTTRDNEILFRSFSRCLNDERKTTESYVVPASSRRTVILIRIDIFPIK